MFTIYSVMQQLYKMLQMVAIALVNLLIAFADLWMFPAPDNVCLSSIYVFNLFHELFYDELTRICCLRMKCSTSHSLIGIHFCHYYILIDISYSSNFKNTNVFHISFMGNGTFNFYSDNENLNGFPVAFVPVIVSF